jgi:hypothetical protein
MPSFAFGTFEKANQPTFLEDARRLPAVTPQMKLRPTSPSPTSLGTRDAKHDHAKFLSNLLNQRKIRKCLRGSTGRIAGSLCREGGGRASILAVCQHDHETEIKFGVGVQSFERQASKSLLVEFDLDN